MLCEIIINLSGYNCNMNLLCALNDCCTRKPFTDQRGTCCWRCPPLGDSEAPVPAGSAVHPAACPRNCGAGSALEGSGPPHRSTWNRGEQGRAPGTFTCDFRTGKNASHRAQWGNLDIQNRLFQSVFQGVLCRSFLS